MLDRLIEFVRHRAVEVVHSDPTYSAADPKVFLKLLAVLHCEVSRLVTPIMAMVSEALLPPAWIQRLRPRLAASFSTFHNQVHWDVLHLVENV